MAAGLVRPDYYFGVAFNADPFDPAATPTWIDLTSRVRSIGSAARGRQYELDQNQAGAMDVSWVNIDEALNPVNTGSPYSPNVQPYRQILARCMWPNPGVGNLLNLTYNGTDGSFESYTAGASVPWIISVGAGVTPVIGTVTPFQGTKCLTYNVTSGGGTNGVGTDIPCIPGRQYTSTWYIRQTGANTTIIFIDGGASGTSTATTGAYVRLSVTWTATQPTHRLWVASFATSINGTVLVDAVQHEPGAVASAFTTTGPMIRSIWTRGYVERWPMQWDPASNGFEGTSTTPCVGPLAILQNADLQTEVRSAVLGLSPAYYWALQDASTATSFIESSGNVGPPLLKTSSPGGAGTVFTAAVTMNIAGDLGGLGVRTGGADANVGALNTPSTSLRLGYDGQPQLTGPSTVSGSVNAWACSLSVWLTRPAATINSLAYFVNFIRPDGASIIGVTAGLSGGTIGTTYGGVSITDLWGDGRPHHYAVVSSITTPNITASLYVDGVLVGTVTSAGGHPSGEIANLLTLQVGAANFNTNSRGGQDQTASNLAYWNRALTLAEIQGLANAGAGYAGELESTRITRYLALGGYTGPSSIGTGASVMGPSTVRAGDAVLASCQRAADSAFGNFYESASGLAYASRNTRYLQTTSTYTFGENVAGGEYPYANDIAYDLDPQLVLNIADVTRSGGAVAHAEDLTGASQKKFGKKNFTRTVDIASDNEAQDAATWVVYNRKSPALRVASVTFNPAATVLPFGDGTLWPMILSLEIGTRVTLKRRPKAANAGAGITMSGDFFIERIDHHDIDFEQGTFLTTLQMTPVNVAQPWILQDAVYGQLDVTTVLGF